MLPQPRRLRALRTDRHRVGQRARVQLLLAKDLALLEIAAFEALSAKTIEVKRMLAGLLSKLTPDD